MLGAMTIYGTNFAISRHGLLHGLTPNDMLLMRFVLAGGLLLPLFIRAGWRDCAGVGWGRGFVLAMVSGVPMTALMMQGLKYAPAAHGATIGPGTVTLMSALGSWLVFGARPTRALGIGIFVVLCGLGLIGFASTQSLSPTVPYGDACFLGVGLIWGSYPLLLQRWKIDGLQAATALSVISAVLVVPWYFATGGGTLMTAPLSTVLVHGFNQGVLNVVVGLWLWGYGVTHLGVSSAGRFPPLIPVIGTLSAIPLLGELPGPLQIGGIGLIVLGLFITTLKRGPKG
jgi:drug/metabolite transporter (DMT)-like permease